MRKLNKGDRRLLKKTGFGREFSGMGALVCALEEAKYGERPEGYAQEPDARYGDMTRRRVQRLQRERCRAAVLHCLLMLAVYGASVATVVVLGFAVYSFW